MLTRGRTHAKSEPALTSQLHPTLDSYSTETIEETIQIKRPAGQYIKYLGFYSFSVPPASSSFGARVSGAGVSPFSATCTDPNRRLTITKPKMYRKRTD